MRSCRQSWMILLVACLTATFVGCPPPSQQNNRPPKKENGSAKPKTGPGQENSVSKGANNTTPPEPDIPPPPTMPKVKLTQILAATCLVQKGDKMPEGELQTVDGKAVPLKELYGEKLTVVFFWDSKNEYSLDELKDLTASVVEPFGEEGVQVIGINVGDTPEVVTEQVEALGAGFPNLLDPGGEYFAKVATEKITRTYLLNAAGTILWFDLEYSITTRHDLPMAIQVVLEK